MQKSEKNLLRLLVYYQIIIKLFSIKTIYAPIFAASNTITFEVDLNIHLDAIEIQFLCNAECISIKFSIYRVSVTKSCLSALSRFFFKISIISMPEAFERTLNQIMFFDYIVQLFSHVSPSHHPHIA